MPLFELPPDKAAAQLGDHQFKQQLPEFCRYINGLGEYEKYRLAPSIITRSEAELFGTSMPRFAIRRYIDGHGSFTNARRVAEFVKRARDARWLTEPSNLGGKVGAEPFVCAAVTHPFDEEAFERLPEICELIEKNSCIGDSLLVPSHALISRFFIANAELGPAYGEHEQARGAAGTRGTPFMRHIEAQGGGLCAQACCFMANALLHDYPITRHHESFTGVHGVAEITAMISPERDNDDYIQLSGLKQFEMSSYFRKIDRNAPLQQQHSPRYYSITEPAFFATALRAYAASGFPVVLAVCRKYITHYGWKDDSRPDFPEEIFHRDHAVVIVGAERQLSPDRAPRFIVNDPASMPFCEADFTALLRISAISDETRKLRKEYRRKKTGKVSENKLRRLRKDFEEQRVMRAVEFMAVTPKEIRLTLESMVVTNDDGDILHHRPGLFDIAHFLQREGVALPTFPYPRQSDKKCYQPGVFQLIQIGRKRQGLKGEEEMGYSGEQILPPAARQQFHLCASELSPFNGIWCWLQYWPEQKGIPESLWLWNAQCELGNCPLWSWTKSGVPSETWPDVRNFEKLLLAVVVRKHDENVWNTEYLRKGLTGCLSPDSIPPVPHSRSASLSTLLKPSLLSSFCTDGLTYCNGHWPAGTPCELYCFMQEDKLLPAAVAGLPYAAPAMERMAALHNNPGEIRKIAANILTTRDSDKGLVDIIGLASFISEISAPAGEACNAVVFLIRLAQELTVQSQEQKRGRWPTFVEIVAGSRIQGIWRGVREVDGPEEYEFGYFARRASRQAEIRRFCDNLAEVVRRSGIRQTRDVCVALELEPGPLYVLNNLQSLCEVYIALRDRDLLSCVGYNLDIGHWALSGISAGDILESIGSTSPKPLYAGVTWQQILDQVVHVHICDHGQGHFSDAPIGDVGLGICADGMNREDVFKAWLEVVAAVSGDPRLTRRKRSETAPPFSCNVSVELEATIGFEAARDSLATLSRLLA